MSMHIENNKRKNELISLLIYVLGLMFWYKFFEFYPASMHGDWFKENVYLEVLRHAVETRRIPYDYVTALHSDYVHFFPIPEICLSPDIFLLPYITNNQFFFLHTSLFYTLGALGTLLLTRNWLAPARLFVFLAFNFNGFILNHLAEGHFQFIGYFSFPLMLWLLQKILLIDINPQKINYVVSLSLLIGFNFLNGSTHAAIWMCLIIGLTALTAGIKNALYLISCILAAGVIGVARIIPSALFFNPISDFITGYPSIKVLMDAFVLSHGPTYGVEISNNLKIGWWEFDFYLGFAMTATILLLLLRSVIYKRALFTWPIILACIALFIASLGDTYELVTHIPLSIAKVERISSRFIALPMTAFIFIAAYEMQRSANRAWLWASVLALGGLELAANSLHYFVNIPTTETRSLAVTYVINQNNSWSYYGVIDFAILISITAAFLCILKLSLDLSRLGKNISKKNN